MWKPWIGSGYQERRVLILGESFYNWREPDSGALITPENDMPLEIADCAMTNPEKPVSKFVDVITKAICNAVKPTVNQSQNAWNSIAYTNYIPVSVGEGAAPRPTREMWRQAELEWPSLLEAVRPRIVIVIGYTMWKRMGPTDPTISDYVGGYRLADGTLAMCWAAPHASRPRWKWGQYAAYIKRAEEETPP